MNENKFNHKVNKSNTLLNLENLDYRKIPLLWINIWKLGLLRYMLKKSFTEKNNTAEIINK